MTLTQSSKDITSEKTTHAKVGTASLLDPSAYDQIVVSHTCQLEV